MVSERNLNLYLLTLLRFAVLWATALRYALILVRLGLKNAKVIHDYHKSCVRHSGRQAIFEIIRGIWLPVHSYTSLFRAFPSLKELEDTQERRRLTKILEETQKICSKHPPTVDPLTAPSALNLQREMIQHTFQRLFGLQLTVTEGQVLARYGIVSLAVRDFLEYCGYGDQLSSYELLGIQLSSFVTWVELRHEKLNVRRKFLSALREKVRLVGRIASLWLRVEQTMWRVYLARGDARERMARLVCHSQAHEMVRRQAVVQMRIVDVASQKSVLSILANQMYLQAVIVLVDLCAKLERMKFYKDVYTKYDRFHERVFKNAIKRLDNNLNAVLRHSSEVRNAQSHFRQHEYRSSYERRIS